MPRRDPSAASRSPSSARGESSRPGGARGGARTGAPKVRSDGKVDVHCPQCGAHYRVAEQALDAKIECTECHRTFFAKTAVGKRARPKDNSKTYLIFAGVGVLIVASFVALSGGSKEPPKRPAPAPVAKEINLGNHPRAQQVVRWANAIVSGDVLGIASTNDMAAVQRALGVQPDKNYANSSGTDRDELDAAIRKALQTHESTVYLRELSADSAVLVDQAAATADTGKALLYLTPKAGNATYDKNSRAEVEVSFSAHGDTIHVTGWTVVRKPVRRVRDPNKDTAFKPNTEIAKRELVEVDFNGQKVKTYESKPGPLGHWQEATAEQRTKADQIVADIVRSADPEAPGNLFNRATMQVQSVDMKKAVVPRILNAMYELYGDVNANNMKLSQLNKAMCGMTGFAVNYDVRGTGDAGRDKTARESCVRQWFAYWYRYANGELSEFLDTRDNLDEPLDAPVKKKN